MIETKTQKGIHVTLYVAKNEAIFAKADLPGFGKIDSPIDGWGKADNTEDVILYVRKNENQNLIVLTVPKEDYQTMESEKKRVKKERLDEQMEAQKAFLRRALINSGSYYLNWEINYVLPLTTDEQEGYRDWAKKSGLHKLAIGHNGIDVEPVKNSTAIAEIFQREPDGILSYTRSRIWYITEEEEQVIRDELRAHYEKKNADRQARKQAREKRRQERQAEIEVLNIDCQTVKTGEMKGGEGPDYFADVVVTDRNTGETLAFKCRNIFDCGYVINPSYEIERGVTDGVDRDGVWKKYTDEGWIDIRNLTDFESRALKYLRLNPPISPGVRL